MNDKEIEIKRYNDRALSELIVLEELIKVSGSATMPETLRAPYILYESLINQHTGPGISVLDLCCGNGIYSLTAARAGANVIATDIAANSLKIAEARAVKENLNIKFEIADSENLKYSDKIFDVVTCAGSLSYVSHELFFKQVIRVLKENGKFICVDSFNHNPIYKLNRLLHYLKGNRSISTVKRIPSTKTLEILRLHFKHVNVEYFGIFSFMSGALKFVMSPEKAARLLDKMDKHFSFLKRYSFKIVIFASNT